MASSDNKRLAKNTALLYIRMLFNLVVTLYTSRVVIRELGVNDFGIYSVVGGLVALFTLLSNSMTSSITRFLTFDLAKGESKHLRQVFSTSVNIQLILGGCILVLIETIGVWFLNFKMNIAPERIYAANWVLQCSAVTFILGMISTPYNACIVAHEKMSAFAYISILETVLKLAIAFFLALRIYDSLITYSVLLMLLAVLIRSIYGGYCNRHFEECHYQFVLEKKIFKDIFAFSGWNFIGAGAGVLRSQGVNVLMNLFFGTVVNAARLLAVQVYSAVYGFSSNLMTALNPQIIKSYAIQDIRRSRTLVNVASKLSFFILMLISIPIIIKTPLILSLWLKEVPDHTVNFVRLALCLGMSDALSNSLLTANQATGKVKVYQITVGGLQLLNFPVVYLAYKLGCAPEISYTIAIIISQICLGARLMIVGKHIDLTIGEFFKVVYSKVILVGIFAFFPLWILNKCLPDNFFGLVCVVLISVIWSFIVIFILGCTGDERREVITLIKKKLHHGH